MVRRRSRIISVLRVGSLRMPSTQEVDKFFRQLDVDGNNKITSDELLYILNLDGITKADIEQFIANFDINHDGCLDKNELHNLLLSLGF
ncbi:hypothetical protein SprV_0301318800 [Sparganum proliferum]